MLLSLLFVHHNRNGSGEYEFPVSADVPASVGVFQRRSAGGSHRSLQMAENFSPKMFFPNRSAPICVVRSLLHDVVTRCTSLHKFLRMRSVVHNFLLERTSLSLEGLRPRSFALKN